MVRLHHAVPVVLFAALVASFTGCGDGRLVFGNEPIGEHGNTDAGEGTGSDGGGSDGGGGEGPGVETVAPATVRAGEDLNVTCLLFDASGDPYTPGSDVTPTVRVVPQGSVEIAGGQIKARRAGPIEVTCAFESLGLTDRTPA